MGQPGSLGQRRIVRQALDYWVRYIPWSMQWVASSQITYSIRLETYKSQDRTAMDVRAASR